MRDFDLAWQRAQFDSGWAGVTWPVEHGGCGLSLVRQMIWYEEYAKLGFPGIDSCFVGNNHAGPTLIVEGSEEQRAAHLTPILRGDVIWAQGFSEPGAGSDLASLSTRAVVDGDELVVTGQKVWTSFADLADWQELLVRTDGDAAPHKGITWVICDLHSPGVDIRPLQTIDGGADFAEVFYDEVRIPTTNVVGALNDGWRVAMSTLAFERGTAFTGSGARLTQTVEQLVAMAGQRGLRGDDEIDRRLATARAEVAALRAMTYASVSRNATRAQPGPEGSMLKLFYAELSQRVYQLAMDMLAGDGLRLGPSSDGQDWSRDYLQSYSYSIGGGTSEIMRNIIGERVLALPRR